MPKALICGISGQDGSYLAQLLLKKGYEVWGTSRDAQLSTFANLKQLGVYDQVHLVSMSLNDFRSTLQVLKSVNPDEIYNLAGQSSVGLSFEQPVETLESISVGALNLLEAIRFLDMNTKLYNAGSGECFGNTNGGAADESFPFRPRSPYAVAKAAAFWQVANYREAYSLYSCSGILFNHESPLRPDRFVTRKIITAACRIANGSRETLQLGNIEIERDWGLASEYVDAMWRMLQQPHPEDYVIATGQTNSLKAFVTEAFQLFGLDAKDHIAFDSELYRPSEIISVKANPKKANIRLGWVAQSKMKDVISLMVSAEKQHYKKFPDKRQASSS